MKITSILQVFISFLFLLGTISAKPNMNQLKQKSYKDFLFLLKDKETMSKFCINVKDLKGSLCDNQNDTSMLKMYSPSLQEKTDEIQILDESLLLKQKLCDKIWAVVTNLCNDVADMGSVGDWFQNVLGLIKRKAERLGDKAKFELKKAAKDQVKSVDDEKKKNGSKSTLKLLEKIIDQS